MVNELPNTKNSCVIFPITTTPSGQITNISAPSGRHQRSRSQHPASFLPAPTTASTSRQAKQLHPPGTLRLVRPTLVSTVHQRDQLHQPWSHQRRHGRRGPSSSLSGSSLNARHCDGRLDCLNAFSTGPRSDPPPYPRSQTRSADHRSNADAGRMALLCDLRLSGAGCHSSILTAQPARRG